MNIHCSACGAPLPQGARFCPACALPLTAIAMPTPAPIRRRKAIWPYFAVAFLLFWLIAYTSDHVSAAHRDQALAAFTADLLPGGKLTTPQAFQAACGKASWSERKGSILTLGYQRLDIRVRFPQQKPVELSQVLAIQTAPGTFKNVERRLSEASVFMDLQCKAAQ